MKKLRDLFGRSEPTVPTPEPPSANPDLTERMEVGGSPVPGITLRRILRGHTKWICRIAWSPDGKLLATPSDDNTVRIWDLESGDCIGALDHTQNTKYCAAWSPDGRQLAASSYGKIEVWNTETWSLSKLIINPSEASIYSVAWSPDGRRLAGCSYDNGLHIWDVDSAKLLMTRSRLNPFVSAAWSPEGDRIVSATYDSVLLILDPATLNPLVSLRGHASYARAAHWLPEENLLASGGNDSTVRIWETTTGQERHILEGHAQSVAALSSCPCGNVLASVSSDNTVRLWSRNSWSEIASLESVCNENNIWQSIAFHPTLSRLATLGEKDTVVRIWDLDLDVLLGQTRRTPTVKYTSAKIVLVGESNAGKSCLAMRLAEDRYPKEEEHGTTHGMRFWPMDPEKLSPKIAAPKGERRDVMLWDMGGQDEYRIVHQLFLHDTTLALVLCDPTRGRTAFDEVEGWNKRLEKQLSGRRATKILVGSKLDKPSTLTDQQAIDRLKRECGFAGYCETSALIGRGIPELREAIAAALDWETLAKTSRPELFQRIRDEIERRRKAGDVVLYVHELNRVISEQAPDLFEPEAVGAVAEQLAVQGVIAQTRLASGEPVLILQIGEVERYAGSLIVAARDNPRGVPALETRNLVAPDLLLPGIAEKDRLERSQELVVLECVIQLLIEHGVCFQHEGLLIFPTLFRPTEQEADLIIPHSISLYYDFSGAVDNIYASLVAWLVIAKAFGRVRLWQDRAEFEKPGESTCGLRKVERRGGFAHVDVYFQEETPDPVRDQFISFVEEHLRHYGVEIVEHVAITCTCGHSFDEETIRRRIVLGAQDVGCPVCDQRTKLTEGAVKSRERDPELAQRT